MINESLKNAFKKMWENNLNLLDISKSDLDSHIHDENPHGITPYSIGAADYYHDHLYAGSSSAGGSATSAVKLDSSAGDSNTPVYFSDGKPVACTSLDLDTSGNAATATKLKTARTIGLNTGATGTATNFDGSGNIAIPVTSVKEAYLDWGGRNINGGVTPVGASLSSEHSANRLAYLNPNAIIVEYSDNAGSTWINYNIPNENKIGFVTTTTNIPIGYASTVTTSHRTRITITAQDGTNGYVYTRPRKMLLNVSSAGHGMSVTVETKTGLSDANWSTVGTYVLSGWSGWNDIPLDFSTLGGGKDQKYNIWYMRLTFATTSVSSNYTTTKSSILGMRLFGDTCWTKTSNMGETGHLYSYDVAQNATFPAKVTATSFKGPLEGNATTATTANKVANTLTIQGNGTTLTNGTFDGSAAKTINITPASIGAAALSHAHNYAGSSSAGGSATSAVKLDSSAGSATNPIYFSNGKPAACTYTLGKSVPSNAKFTDTTYNNATTSTDGLMSSSDKTKLDGIAAGATKTIVDSALSSTSINPVQNKVIYGAISTKADLDTSGKVLSSQLPSYVDDVLEYSAKSNFPSTGESGKIYVDTATNLTYRWSGSAYVEISQSLALGETSSTAYRGDRGKIAYDHSQTSHAPTNAEVNQNAFSNVKVGSTTVSADSKTDTLELVAGTNVTLTPDAANDKITITTNDTKNTAGSTDTSSKIFLVGATSQAANPQTYSHNTAYVGTDGCLYSNSTKVSVEGHTHTVANISDLTATATELNYCDGVTSNIQTQLNNTVKLSGDQTINGNKTFTGVIILDDPDAAITPSIYTDFNNCLKISVGEKLFWMNSDGQFHSSADGRFIGENTLSTYGVTGIKGNAESSYRKGNVNITPANIGAAASSHTHSASNITAGTLGGSVVANTTAVGTLTTKQLRNITISTADPTSSDGGNGDVWIRYGNTQSNCPFPVGGIYISIASTDPSSIWAGTTWEQFAKGRTLVGLNSSDSNFNTVGQTGGEKTHTLTPDEIPAHGHGMAHTHSYTGPNTGSWKVGTGKAHTWCTSAGGKTSGGASKTTTDNAGGGLGHNNLQPYIVVYMWKRVS